MSALLHVLVISGLATLTLRVEPIADHHEILVASSESPELRLELPPPERHQQLDVAVSAAPLQSRATKLVSANQAMSLQLSFPATADTTAPTTPKLSTSLSAHLLGVDDGGENHLLTRAAQRGDGLGGRRDPIKRRQLLLTCGGTPESETAVEAALHWIVTHQSAIDGSWSFDHTSGACGGRCGEPGTLIEGRNGSTAIALLPLLGAGMTHQTGEHRGAINRGLKFLLAQMKQTEHGGSFHEPSGRMYSHALATLALCECYAMTGDESLRQPAQQALRFIEYAQDPIGGGWRYVPKQKGDTSVVGWQVMALKSGRMAALAVDSRTLRGASRFLDSVSTASGSGYGYTDPGESPATSAVGLLCRIHLGVEREDVGLERGVALLDKIGPSHDMYYNYYATQVMRHYEGKPWRRWNDRLRDWLVTEQCRTGHAAGSWHFAGGHGVKPGGRLLITSLGAMMLEVYYRHLPIYGAQNGDKFQL